MTGTPGSHAATARNDIVDHSDFCRLCKGTGGEREPTERGTLIWEPCRLCRGSGYSTVRVD